MTREWSFKTALSRLSSSDDDPIGESDDDLGESEFSACKEELERAQQLRQAFADQGEELCHGRWMEDVELLRYIRARPVAGEDEVLLRQMLSWRSEKSKAWSVDLSATGSFGSEQRRFRECPSQAPAWWTFLRERIHVDVYGADRYGIPISYTNVGASDFRGCEREVGFDKFQRYVVYSHDYFFDQARAVAKKRAEDAGEVVVLHGGILVVDVCGIGWRHMKDVRLMQEISEVCKFLHPERQRRCFIVRAPRSFSMIWRVVSPTLEPRTREKFMIIGEGESLEPLFDELGAENVPKALGGGYVGLPERSSDLVPVGAFAEHCKRVEPTAAT